MGANAQTTVPTFTASQVLTADQMNQSARTGVPVFATTVTRDAGFGGTGEKSLAEGQMCYIEGTGFQTYNGTSWVTWGTAPSTGGLVFISNTAFTTATSVSLPTSTFTSTYTNYRVIFTLTASTGTGSITGRLRTSGTDNSSALYFQMSPGIKNNGTADNQNQTAATSFALGSQGSATVPVSNIILDFLRPNVNAAVKVAAGSATFYDNVNYVGRALSLVFENATAFQVDSFSFISSAASSMTGNVLVYGYANS